MKIKRISLYELSGEKMYRPEMRFLVGGCMEPVEIVCSDGSDGQCFEAYGDDLNPWLGCRYTGCTNDFCVYGK